MLHQEALLGLEQAIAMGPGEPTYSERIKIANRTEDMAVEVERRLAAECPALRSSSRG